MTRTRIGFVAVLAAAIIGGALIAQERQKVIEKDVKVEKNVQPGDARELPSFRAKQILGAKVSLEENAPAGTVDDIVLDANGNVDYLIVAVEDGKFVTVPWDAAVFNPEKRQAVVHITEKQFQAVPTYTAEQYPVFSQPTYRTQVYKYYGLTPGQERRTIRRATR